LSPEARNIARIGADSAQPKAGTPVQVLVRDNNVDQALKVLKKKMQREGVFREMKLRSHYEKPSERKTREKAEAIRRARKLARKKMQREGLLPMKPRIVRGPPGKNGGRAVPSADPSVRVKPAP
jgi:small subunit ribosomal protein S21